VLRDDRIVVMEAVKNRPDAFQHASERLKNDRVFAAEIITHTEASYLPYLSDRLRGDRDVVLRCVELDGSHLEHSSDDCKQDRDVVATAVRVARKQDSWARGGNLRHASDALKRDGGFVLELMEACQTVVEHCADELKSDRQFMLKAVSMLGMSLCHATEALNDDCELAAEAIKQDSSCYTYYISDRLKADPQLAAMAAAGGQFRWGMPDNIAGSRGAMLAVVGADGGCLRYAPEALRADREVVLAAVRQAGGLQTLDT
jgi:hypothetical protein